MESIKTYLIEEVAKELKCTERTVYTYLTQGKIKGVKIGNKWQVTEEEVNYIKLNGLRTNN